MRIVTILIATFLLSACVKQEQVDSQMSKGCEAGVRSILQTKNREIKNIKSINFSKETVNDKEHRVIVIAALEKKGWLELDREYSCSFQENWGFFKLSHNPELLNIEVHGEVYGNKDGNLKGSLENFLKLTDVVENAMEVQ